MKESTLLLVMLMCYLHVGGGKEENFELKINMLCSKHGTVLLKSSKKYSVVTTFFMSRIARH